MIMLAVYPKSALDVALTLASAAVELTVLVVWLTRRQRRLIARAMQPKA